MKGIPSLAERYDSALKRVQDMYRKLEEAGECLDYASRKREKASTEYNMAMNDLQTMLLLNDIKNGKVTVNNARTGEPVKIAFI